MQKGIDTKKVLLLSLVFLAAGSLLHAAASEDGIRGQESLKGTLKQAYNMARNNPGMTWESTFTYIGPEGMPTKVFFKALKDKVGFRTGNLMWGGNVKRSDLADEGIVHQAIEDGVASIHRMVTPVSPGGGYYE